MQQAGPQRKRGRSPAVVGAVLLLLSMAGLTAQIVGSERAHSSSAEEGGALGSTETEAFYTQVRDSLTPLLGSAPRLLRLLGEVEAGRIPAPTVAKLGEAWTKDFRMASELVGQLTPPDSGGIADARLLYQLGASLYAEAATTVPRMVAAAGAPDALEAARRSARRLQVLGDRLLDAGNRLLVTPAGRGVVPVERVLLPPAVPDFAQLGIHATANRTGPPTPPGRETEAGQTPSLDGHQWASGHRQDLEGARGALQESLRWLALGNGTTGSEASAEALEHWSGRLGTEPGGEGDPEGAHLLRLGLLVASESMRTLTLAEVPNQEAAGGSAALDQGRRLRIVGERLWDLGADLLASGTAGDRPFLELSDRLAPANK